MRKAATTRNGPQGDNAGMGNEILAVIENDSLRMGSLHLRGKVYGAVAAGCVGDVIDRRLKWIGRLIHRCLLGAPIRQLCLHHRPKVRDFLGV
jgi:hypothetical protein